MSEKRGESAARDIYRPRAVAAESCAREKSGLGLVREEKGRISLSCTLCISSANTSTIFESSHEPTLRRRGPSKDACACVRAQCAILPRRPVPAHKGSRPKQINTKHDKLNKRNHVPFRPPFHLSFTPDPIKNSLHTARSAKRRCLGLLRISSQTINPV